MGTKKKIIVADDDQGVLEAIQMILELDGHYEVIITSQAESLLEKFPELPDLILLDIWMSGIDGRDVCKALKADESTKDIPVILISANQNLEEMAKYALANDYISKPFDVNYLLKKVATHVDSAPVSPH